MASKKSGGGVNITYMVILGVVVVAAGGYWLFGGEEEVSGSKPSAAPAATVDYNEPAPSKPKATIRPQARPVERKTVERPAAPGQPDSKAPQPRARPSKKKTTEKVNTSPRA